MSETRFVLEQSIMDCWSVTNDLQTIAQLIDRLEMPAKSSDTLTTVIQGVEALYQAKFEFCFEQFEKLLKEYHNSKESFNPYDARLGE